MKVIFFLAATLCITMPALAQENLPETGISGVYEVMTGVKDAAPVIEYFAEFGFRVVAEARIEAAAARALYGVDSALHSYRLQNGAVDSHGLLRILEWAHPVGEGVGYSPADTIGLRMAVMNTRDVVRIHDVFQELRKSRQPWLPTPPIFDDPLGVVAGEQRKPSIKDRRTGVREMAVYGSWFNHVFFQRYGYRIPGYGTVGADAPLQTSEFTHHDFLIKGDVGEVTRYYSQVLGLRPEGPPSLHGDWLPGPRRVFKMKPGTSHWYIGFVSPNNICGKLKFFAPRDLATVADRSAQQRIGELGITLHSLYTPRLEEMHRRAREFGLEPTAVRRNEFGEQSFVFTGPDGASWQILEDRKPAHPPVREFKYQRVRN